MSTYKNLNHWVKREYTERDGKISYHQPAEESWITKEVADEFAAMPANAFIHHPATSNSHYTALNCLPIVAGTRWAISEDIYNEFLGMMPPRDLPFSFRKACGFVMCEAATNKIYSAYYREGGQYWHEWIEII